MKRDDALSKLTAEITACRLCPRLVEWREEVAVEKRAAYADEEYWGRPVPGFGDPEARVVVVGLAPAAHGANRTGRMFTGDRSGEWLYRSMWRTGFANQAESIGLDDGLMITGAWVTAPVRCAPPVNRPSVDERDTCARWFDRELDILAPDVLIALGGFAYQSIWRYLADRGRDLPRPRPRFAHGLEIAVPDGPMVLVSFHVSQQNTFTGRLTEDMLDAVFARARALSQPPSPPHEGEA
jgi:uracil-DNA glycosylase family 4